MSPVYLAACGETLNIDFTLPFHEFVPATCNTRFCLRVSIGTCSYAHCYFWCVWVFFCFLNKGDHSFLPWLPQNACCPWFSSLRQKTQICGFVCLTATPVDILYSLLRKIISKLRLPQTMACQQKPSGLQRTTKLAGEIWPKPSMKALSFLASLHPLIVGLMSVSKFCFCLGLDGWTVGVCQISCSL